MNLVTPYVRYFPNGGGRRGPSLFPDGIAGPRSRQALRQGLSEALAFADGTLAPGEVRVQVHDVAVPEVAAAARPAPRKCSSR